MAEAVYLMCALTSLACAAVLLRGYLRARLTLVLWTSVCFVGLALQNVLLFIDLAILPNDVQLAVVRNAIGLGGHCALLYGLVAKGIGRSG